VSDYFRLAGAEFAARVEQLAVDPGTGDRLRTAVAEVAGQLEGRQAAPLPPVPVVPAPTGRDRLRAWLRGLR